MKREAGFGFENGVVHMRWPQPEDHCLQRDDFSSRGTSHLQSLQTQRQCARECLEAEPECLLQLPVNFDDKHKWFIQVFDRLTIPGTLASNTL